MTAITPAPIDPAARLFIVESTQIWIAPSADVLAETLVDQDFFEFDDKPSILPLEPSALDTLHIVCRLGYECPPHTPLNSLRQLRLHLAIEHQCFEDTAEQVCYKNRRGKWVTPDHAGSYQS